MLRKSVYGKHFVEEKVLGGEKKEKMKTKNKMMATLEIVVVLCSVLLVALPVTTIAAEQDDYVLGVYGNANEDDTIDMRDLTYVKLIFFGKKPETELADAKYDGKINPLDFIQIKLIIVGKEKELTLMDSADRIVTVKKPIKRIVLTLRTNLEALRTLKVSKDMIIGISTDIKGYVSYYPEFSESDLPTVGAEFRGIDVEKILELKPDVVLAHGGHGPTPWPFVQQLETAGIKVLCFKSHIPELYPGEIEKLGYVFDTERQAEEHLVFYEDFLNSIKDKTKDIPEEDKPKVYCELAQFGKYHICDRKCDEYLITMAGGKNIFPIEPWGKVDPEAVIVRNPDIIVRVVTDDADARDAGDIEKLKEARDEIMSRPELQDVTAVKKGNVFVIATPIWSSFGYAGGRHFVGAGYLAKWFHPDLFEDLDPQAIHQEYLTGFQGLDYDLDEKGVFVYHLDYHPDGR